MISVAASESVRATSTSSAAMMSACARHATSRLTCSRTGTITLPPMCPHFFVPGAWSSTWMPAAPRSMKSLVSFIVAVKPPWPVSASATMGRR